MRGTRGAAALQQGAVPRQYRQLGWSLLIEPTCNLHVHFFQMDLSSSLPTLTA